MNNRLLLAIAAASALFCGISCTPEENIYEKDPELTLDPTELSVFDADGGSQTVQVSSTRDWMLDDIDEDWIQCSVDGKDAAGTEFKASTTPVTVKISVLKNTGADRSATLTFNGGTLAKAYLTISQGSNIKPVTIKSVCDMIGSEKVTLPEGTYIKGYVNSNSDLNNLNSNKSVYMQDETAGINLFCESGHSLKFGDEILVNLSGQSLELYSGAKEINGLPLANISVISSGNTVEPKSISMEDFLANKYESIYVSLSGVQAYSDAEATWVKSTSATSVNFSDAQGRTFVVRSGKLSTYGSEKVPTGSGTIKGISTYYNGTLQIIFAQNSDYADLTGERFTIKGESVSVDDAIATEAGKAVTVKGRVLATSPAGFVINDGTLNNLYIASTNSGTEVGDLVEVSGTTSKYRTVIRLTDCSVSETGETISPTPEQTAEELEASEIKAYAPVGTSPKVTVAGELSSSESNGITYYNIKFDGVTDFVGSIYTGEDISALVGKRIRTTGYYVGATNSYWMVVAESVEEDKTSYCTVTPETIDVAATVTSAEFQIATNLDWTVSSENESVSFDISSGSGNATVVVSFPANEDIENEVTLTVKISTTLGDKEITIKQGKAADPDADFVELTNAEIVASLVARDSTATSYSDVVYKSASGDWTSNSSQSKTNKWVQIRDTKGSFLKSPEFAKNIEKIEISTDANKSKPIRTFYALPADTEIPNSSDSYSTSIATALTGAYGKVVTAGFSTTGTAGTVGETVSLEFGADAKQFILVTTPEGSSNKNGASYINSIKVYFKK